MADGRRRALMTGAASGVGAATCRALAGPGVALAVHTRRGDREGAERAAAAARERGGEACVPPAGLAEPGAPGRPVEEAAAALGGGPDAPVPNAGSAGRTPVAELGDGGFARGRNAVAFLRLARAAGPLLRAGRDPRPVAVSPFVARVFRTDLPVFPASAAAARPCGRMRAAHDGRRGVAGLRARGPRRARGGRSPGRGGAGGAHPARGVGGPADAAAAIASLLSPGASCIIGQVVRADGGLTA